MVLSAAERAETPEQIAVLKDPATGHFLPGNRGSNGYEPTVFESLSPEKVKQIADDYIRDCTEQQISATVPGLAYALGFDSKSGMFRAINYGTGARGTGDTKSSVVHALKRLHLFIESQRVQRMVDGKGNVVGAIFDLKNNHNYVDKQEIKSRVEVIQTLPPGEAETLKELARKMIEEREGEILDVVEELDL